MTDDAQPTGLLQADQMAYRARALAQAEVFTPLARAILNDAMTAEREAQPGNFSIWANAAFTKGYCVRNVEEDDVGMTYATTRPEDMPDRATVEEMTDKIAAALRTEEADISAYLISDEARLYEVLDQIIGSEVRNRLDNVESTLSARARGELEDYLTYWVVKGYALRAAEQATGAITKA